VTSQSPTKTAHQRLRSTLWLSSTLIVWLDPSFPASPRSTSERSTLDSLFIVSVGHRLSAKASTGSWPRWSLLVADSGPCRVSLFQIGNLSPRLCLPVALWRPQNLFDWQCVVAGVVSAVCRDLTLSCQSAAESWAYYNVQNLHNRLWFSVSDRRVTTLWQMQCLSMAIRWRGSVCSWACDI